MRQLILLSTLCVASYGLCSGQTITQSPTRIKSPQANTSGLGFTNLNSNSPAAASNGKNLSVDGTGNVILTLAPSGTTSYWQLTGNDIANTNTGTVKITNLQAGNSTIAVAGSIRWNGTDFEGYNGTAWVSLTQAAKITRLWVTAINHGGTSWVTSPCAVSCPSNLGYIPAADPSGYVCIGARGAKTKVTADGSGYWCGEYTPFKDNVLYQCHCVKVN